MSRGILAVLDERIASLDDAFFKASQSPDVTQLIPKWVARRREAIDRVVEARAAVVELIESSRKLRNYVDISTIRPGKATEEGWIARVVAIDEALKRADGAK